MSPEILNGFEFSDFYKMEKTISANWNEANLNYLKQSEWRPVCVHTTDRFAKFVHFRTQGKEGPPYKGIYNPGDERSVVLFPWVRAEDLYKLMLRLIEGEGVDGFLTGITGDKADANAFKQSNTGLTIPLSEIISFSKSSHLI